jgi:predicted transcriptional regulator of viral defense system
MSYFIYEKTQSQDYYCSPDVALEDPWIIAEQLYSPCYIGGWSAAEYWGLTEQLFRTIVVMTTRKPRDRKPAIKGTNFLVRTVPAKALFGTKPIWRGQVKVNVSNQTRTILDMLNDPALGGGIQPTADVLKSYLKSEQKDTTLLISYADRLGNGAIFKRLGFLAERIAKDEKNLIEACRSRLSAGNAKLDVPSYGQADYNVEAVGACGMGQGEVRDED